LDIVIKPEETSDNPGMKALAKLCLNSLWGKFGQRSDLPKSETCTSIADVNRLIHNKEITNCRVEAYDVDSKRPWVEIRYKKASPFDSPAESTNTAWAAATTANARIRLHTMLNFLHPSQVTYCDTDSCILEYDPHNPNHKHPDSEEARARGISLGKGLGQWEDEMEKGEEIVEFAAIGPKCYAYKTSKGNMAVKMKGVPLNYTNKNRLQYTQMVKLAKGYRNEVKTTGFTFKKSGMCDNIQTVPLERTVKRTVHKRRLDVFTGETRPFNSDLMNLPRSTN